MQKVFSRNRNTLICLCYLVLGGILIYILFQVDDVQLLHSKTKNMLLRIMDTTEPSFREEVVWWRRLLCKNISQQLPENKQNSIFLQQLFRDIKPKANDKNVFLLETNCNSQPLFRAWCSVESWAHQNPKLNVWFVLTSEIVDDTDGLPSRLLQRYKNLQVVGADLDGIFAGTPAKEFFRSGNWTKNMAWVGPHLSDMLRAALVWHWGGIYSDTDMMCLKDMTKFADAIGFQSGSEINNAFFHMKDHTKYLRMILEELQISFQPFLWTSIGVRLYTRIMERECEAENIKFKHQKEPLTCSNITMYPTEMFYPIPPQNYQKYFEREVGKNFSEDFKDSSLLHLWNKLSNDHATILQSESIYEVAAKTLCPVTYEDAVRRSKFF